jgi:hypothetical protein
MKNLRRQSREKQMRLVILTGASGSLDARPRMMESGGFAVAAVCSILLAHYAAVLPHEYAHSFMAFALGFKSQPLAIHFGSNSLASILLLSNIDEHVDYHNVFAQGAAPAAAVIGFAGLLANGALYLVSLILMRLPSVRTSTLLFMLVYWFSFMNAGNLYDYIPIRTFTSHADIGHITEGLGISQWLALVVFGTPTAAALWYLFTRTLPLALACIAPSSTRRQTVIVTLSVVIMFGVFGLAGWSGYGEISRALSAGSMCLVPPMLILCWPTRKWIRALMVSASGQ